MAEELINEATDYGCEEQEEVVEDENLRKLFLGGLNRSTTKEDIEEHFSKLGNVASVSVAQDAQNNSKGFAFVTMATISETDTVLHEQENGTPMELQGRTIEVRRAIPRNSNVTSDLVKKVFVAGLNKGSISEDDLKDYFNSFATVKSVSIVMDKHTQQSKGYGFVELENYYMVDKAALMTNHVINDIKVDVNKAHADKNQGGTRGGRGGYGGGGRGGGGGGGRGGRGGYGRGGYGGDSHGGGRDWGNGYNDYDSYSGYDSGYYGSGYSSYGPSGGYDGYSGGSRGRGRGSRYRPY